MTNPLHVEPLADTVWLVTFEDGRIGRNHSFTEPVEFDAFHKNPHPDELAHSIYKFVRPHLMSNDVNVTVDLEKGEGSVFVGFHVGARFKIRKLGEAGG